MSSVFEVVIQIATLLMSVAALVVSVALWYRDKHHFRGPEVTLANQSDEQHSVLVPFADFPQSLRDLFPDYGDRLPCVLAKAVWLNTGDRAGFIHTKKIHAVARGRTYRCAYYSYIEIAAGSAVLQPIIVRNLPAEESYEIEIHIEFAWQRIRPDGRKREDGRGIIKSRVKPADAPRVISRVRASLRPDRKWPRGMKVRLSMPRGTTMKYACECEVLPPTLGSSA